MDNIEFAVQAIFLFPSLTALLPAVIIGYISNAILEEKFQLICSEDITNDNEALCFGSDYGCCEIISSHEFMTSFAFFGILSSNILFMLAVIRVAEYIMSTAIDDMAIFVKPQN